MTDRQPPRTVRRIVFFLCGLSALLGPGAEGVGGAQATDPKTTPTGTPTAETVLRKTADFFKKAETVAVDVERVQTIGDLTIKSTLSMAVQRPNRFAIRQQAGAPGAEVISDGKTMFTSIAPLRKYTEAEAPASIDALAGDPFVQSALVGSMIGQLFAADPYGKLMEGVKTATYAGLEPLDGAKAHHLTFTQDQFDWEMWVAADGDPIIRRVVMDFTKSLANMPFAGAFKDQKLVISQDFKDWRIDRKLDAKSFAFQPPEGAEKVEDFMAGFAGGGGQEQPSPLLGESAPDVDLKLLDKGEFKLKDHRDASVVVLDFWATWCGPCVQELPILAEVAASYKDKGVVFCAVNLREKPDQIRKFLEEKKLEITVALDPEGEVGAAYHAEAIPLLVLIDKKGKVQSVHVGYNPAIKATLGKELDAILAGKDLAGEALRAAKRADPELMEGLEQAWTVSGPYAGVATDTKGQSIYAVQLKGRCDLIDIDGKTTRTFLLAANDHTNARCARLPGGAEGLLTFRSWGTSVLASKDDGTKLWEETGGQGVDDVWAADLDGDGVDEAIVGYNGATGLHAFAADGQRLWKRTDLGNVWHVTAGDLDGDGGVDVVTTSAQGKVHVFSAADGQPVRTLDAGLYANMVRTAPGRSIPPLKGDVVLVVGSGPADVSMVAMGGDGKALWTIDLPDGSQSCDSLSVSPGGTFAAAGLRGGSVCVVDVARGRIVARVSGQGTNPMVAWATRADAKSPLLLVATGRALNAFRIKPVAAPPENSRP